MGILATILGIIGGLAGVMGILDAADIIPRGIGLTTVDWTFWLLLAAVLILGSIACTLNNRGEID